MTRSAPSSSVYEEDFFTWTQEQAVALRRAGQHADLDIEHLAAEIEDLGKRDLREVTSLLRLLFLHFMKLKASPLAPSVPHWRSEAREFARAASRAFTPGMRQLIDVSELWLEAETRFAEQLRDLGLPHPRVPACPFELEDLLTQDFDLDRALTMMKVAYPAADGSAERSTD